MVIPTTPGGPVPDIPVSDVDLFTDDARVDPYPIYRTLRDLGPVVEMSRHGHYALPRYADVRAALMDAASPGTTPSPATSTPTAGPRTSTRRPTGASCRGRSAR
jgi:cytochrome P450